MLLLKNFDCLSRSAWLFTSHHLHNQKRRSNVGSKEARSVNKTTERDQAQFVELNAGCQSLSQLSAPFGTGKREIILCDNGPLKKNATCFHLRCAY